MPSHIRERTFVGKDKRPIFNMENQDEYEGFEMTTERLQEIRERLEKATKGPWKWDGDVCNTTSKYRKHEAPWLVSDDDEAIPVLTGDIKARRTPDAQLISNAPQDIAELLAYVKELEERK